MLYLLDTNTCIALLRGHPLVTQRMAVVAPTYCAISSISIYELYTGVEKLSHSANERAKVDLLVASLDMRVFDEAAAKEAARVRAALESLGQPIGPYDTLLAGHALSAGLIVVSANEREFNRVPRLRVQNWQI